MEECEEPADHLWDAVTNREREREIKKESVCVCKAKYV